jgi:hypothetical protein
MESWLSLIVMFVSVYPASLDKAAGIALQDPESRNAPAVQELDKRALVHESILPQKREVLGPLSKLAPD